MSQKYRKPLSTKQVELLQLIYKFRFATVKLVNVNIGQKNLSVTRRRLSVLLQQEYIGRNYSKSDRFLNNDASYFLRPNAIRYLKEHLKLSHKTAHRLYYDKSAKPSFINHCLTVFSLHNQLHKLYPGQHDFYTSGEITGYSYLPKQLPDGYVAPAGASAGASDLFLDYIEESKSFFLFRAKLNCYFDHYESEIWQNKNSSTYPKILFVCSSEAFKKRLQKYIARQLDNRDVVGLEVFTTSLKTFLNADAKEGEIWKSTSEEGVNSLLTN